MSSSAAPSIEALAMAGADYAQCQQLEDDVVVDGRAPPPLPPRGRLLLPDDVDDDDGRQLEEEMFGECAFASLRGVDGRLREQQMKQKLVGWSKAVADLVLCARSNRMRENPNQENACTTLCR